MTTWFFIAIGYGGIVLTIWICSFWLSEKRPFKRIRLGLLILIFILVTTPFIWMWNMTNPYTLFFNPKYKIDSTHKITPNNEIALLSMGFKKDDNFYEVNTGFVIKGYIKKGKNTIFVQDSGTITIKYTNIIFKETKTIVKLIKEFPKEKEESEHEKSY